jgi:hypothetical protein
VVLSDEAVEDCMPATRHITSGDPVPKSPLMHCACTWLDLERDGQVYSRYTSSTTLVGQLQFCQWQVRSSGLEMAYSEPSTQYNAS